MAYFSEKQSKIILEEKDKEVFEECEKYFVNGKKSILEFPKYLNKLIK